MTDEPDYTIDDYDHDLGDCFNCGGGGFVNGCSWEWQCDTWDGDSCLCTRPCHICHPPKLDPELRKIMAESLAQGTSVRMDQDPQGLEAKPAGPTPLGDAPDNNHLPHDRKDSKKGVSRG